MRSGSVEEDDHQPEMDAALAAFEWALDRLGASSVRIAARTIDAGRSWHNLASAAALRTWAENAAHSATRVAASRLWRERKSRSALAAWHARAGAELCALGDRERALCRWRSLESARVISQWRACACQRSLLSMAAHIWHNPHRRRAWASWRERARTRAHRLLCIAAHRLARPCAGPALRTWRAALRMRTARLGMLRQAGRVRSRLLRQAKARAVRLCIRSWRRAAALANSARQWLAAVAQHAFSRWSAVHAALQAPCRRRALRAWRARALMRAALSRTNALALHGVAAARRALHILDAHRRGRRRARTHVNGARSRALCQSLRWHVIHSGRAREEAAAVPGWAVLPSSGAVCALANTSDAALHNSAVLFRNSLAAQPARSETLPRSAQHAAPSTARASHDASPRRFLTSPSLTPGAVRECRGGGCFSAFGSPLKNIGAAHTDITSCGLSAQPASAVWARWPIESGWGLSGS